LISQRRWQRALILVIAILVGLGSSTTASGALVPEETVERASSVLVQPANYSGMNLVADASFEQQASGSVGTPWVLSGNGGVDRGIGQAYSGGNNGWLRSTSGWHNIFQPVAVTPHQRYRVSGWLRTSANNSSGFFGIRTPNGAVIAELRYGYFADYTEVSVEFDSGGNSTVHVFAGMWAVNGDTWVNVDDVSVVLDDPLLRSDTGLYPRVVRLEHGGVSNGRILASVVTFLGGAQGVGAIYESTDSGASFSQVGEVADPEAGSGRGLCCATLFELPRQIGSMPAGTLLWAASMRANARPMAIRIWRSNDIGRTWSYLSTCAVAGNTGGLWEPEFSVAADGRLVCHYADETDGAHSQKLVEVGSSDGLVWVDRRDTVAVPTQAHRPGMPVVRRLPSGTYVMAYEICALGGQYDCAVHLRMSPDGWSWGDPAMPGSRPSTVDGSYFTHAPTIAWTATAGSGNGKIALIGQIYHRFDGVPSPYNGRTVLVNAEGGHGFWYEVPAPVAVNDPYNNFCPNYSSPLLPSVDGTQVLGVATDYDGGACKASFDTGSLAGTGDATGVASGATFRLVSVQSGHCLDVAADSRVNGGNVQQWTCNNLGPQNWIITSHSGDYFTLRGQNSDLCLDVAGGSVSPGANVQQWTCNNLHPQIWRLERR
jgi:hypothetical protein